MTKVHRTATSDYIRLRITWTPSESINITWSRTREKITFGDGITRDYAEKVLKNCACPEDGVTVGEWVRQAQEAAETSRSPSHFLQLSENFVRPGPEAIKNHAKSKVESIHAYMVFRARMEGIKHNLSIDYYATMWNKGVRDFFGVIADETGVPLFDTQNPKALVAWLDTLIAKRA